MKGSHSGNRFILSGHQRYNFIAKSFNKFLFALPFVALCKYYEMV